MTPQASETIRAALKAAYLDGTITGHERDHAIVELATVEAHESGLASAWQQGYEAGMLDEGRGVGDDKLTPNPYVNP